MPTQLYVAPREGHNWGELRHLLFKAQRRARVVRAVREGRVYVWEKAPGDAPLKLDAAPR